MSVQNNFLKALKNKGFCCEKMAYAVSLIDQDQIR